MKIFIHGNSGSPSNFKSVAEKDDVLLTIPGHEGVKAPLNCDLISLGKIIGEEISSYISPNSPYQIVAHSLGSNVAVHAIDYLRSSGLKLPEKLIIIAGPLLTKLDNLGKLFLSESSGVIFSELNPLRESLERAIILNNLKNDGLNQFIDGFKNTEPNFRVRFIESVGRGQFLNELEIIKEEGIPTHFILGSNDPFIDKENLFNQASSIPLSKFTLLEGLAHYPHLENPSLLKKTLLALNQDISHHNNIVRNDAFNEKGI